MKERVTVDHLKSKQNFRNYFCFSGVPRPYLKMKNIIHFEFLPNNGVKIRILIISDDKINEDIFFALSHVKNLK